jgi:DNA-directed RNA polymerase specialized sigma24 family protein
METTPELPADLLERLRADEPAARSELFERCQARLRPFFRLRLPDPSDVEDCVSEVVARALEGIRKGHRPEVLDAWVMGIARNLLKHRYAAKGREDAELPDLPVEFESLIGKFELLTTMRSAIQGISPGLQPIMREHIRLSLEHNRLVVGTELSAALRMPVERLDRRLDRARKATRGAVAALVVARGGRGKCPELTEIVGPQLTGRNLVLDPARTNAVTKHATGCALCGPRANEAREYGRWALGPGLVGFADDDDERRRAAAAFFSRMGDAAPSPVAAVGVVDRLRAAVTARVASSPRLDAVVRLAQENPEAVRRFATAAVGGVVVVTALVIALLGTDSDQLSAAPAGTATTAPAASPATTAKGAGATTTATSTSTSGKATSTVPNGQSTTGTTAATTATTTAVTPAKREEIVVPADSGDIVFDARALDYTGFSLVGVPGWQDTKQFQSLRLAPGEHHLVSTAGTKVDFRVTEDRLVDYDQSLDGYVSGRGTPTLTVTGVAVTVDVSDTAYYTTAVTGTGWPGVPESVRTLHLLPGPHAVISPVGNKVDFRVTPAGAVDYDSPLLTGRGTPALAVHGLPITVDTADTGYYTTAVSGTGWLSPYRPVRTLKLLPGTHSVLTPAGNKVDFAVTDAGVVDYDPSLEGVLVGRGSPTLAAHGFDVTADATGSGRTTFTIPGTPGWLAAAQPHTARLLPGGHEIVSPEGTRLAFRVTGAGLVDYAPSLDGAFAGRGTSTLTIR